MREIYTPDWVKDAVFYQIFPDRFARSNRIRHQKGIQFKEWGSPPEEQGFQGGDLLGIVDKLDYLRELGITALYLNPIFSSASNHRYHAFDYYKVDPLLGGDDALRELLNEAHKRGIRVVLDGVFNHASRGFWQFHHILENGVESPYIDWFHINGFPLRPYSGDKKNPINYESWWGYPALPKLNTKNPGVRDMLFDITRYWLEFGIDGWRLDVPMGIDDDDFWREFRYIVKSTNPEAYIVGEIWSEAKKWLKGDMFDAVMNYIFTGNAISFFGGDSLDEKAFKHPELNLRHMNAVEFRAQINEMMDLYEWPITQAQLNLLDSHDMPRALWLMSDDKAAYKLAVLFLLTMPGAPCIYYGDEIGLSAGGDPYCREAFPWGEEEQWDKDILNFVKKVTRLRHQNPVLRTGTFKSIYAEKDVYAFSRKLNGNIAICLFNRGEKAQSVEVDIPDLDPTKYYEIFPSTKQEFVVENGTLRIEIPAQDALILIS